MFNILSKKQAAEFAASMVIMDAMEKGHTNKEQLIEYMNSETFKKAVTAYLDTMNTVSKELQTAIEK